jgi:poly(A) polymerase Pap1
MFSNIQLLLQQDFFTTLYGILAQMVEVTELQPVPDAHIPVMKFKLQGISINLIYASVSLAVVPSVSFYSIECFHEFIYVDYGNIWCFNFLRK